MKKLISIIMVITLFLLAELNSFAQNPDSRVRDLQGEWIVNSVQMEDEVTDLTKSPFKEMFEMLWKFEGNNFFAETTNRQTGEKNIDTGTFTATGNSLMISVDEKPDAFSYNLQGNILTATAPDGSIFTLRKR